MRASRPTVTQENKDPVSSPWVPGESWGSAGAGCCEGFKTRSHSGEQRPSHLSLGTWGRLRVCWIRTARYLGRLRVYWIRTAWSLPHPLFPAWQDPVSIPWVPGEGSGPAGAWCYKNCLATSMYSIPSTGFKTCSHSAENRPSLLSLGTWRRLGVCWSCVL